VRATGPPATLVRSPGGIQAQRPVRSAADHSAIVIVLAVVFPAALAADVVAAALGEGRVTAAWACVGFWPARSIDVALRRVRLEPGLSLLDKFLVRKTRVIPWPSIHGSLRRVVSHAIQYDSEGGTGGHLPRDRARSQQRGMPATVSSGHGSECLLSVAR
jgi:hypothetical protein